MGIVKRLFQFVGAVLLLGAVPVGFTDVGTILVMMAVGIVLLLVAKYVMGRGRDDEE